MVQTATVTRILDNGCAEVTVKRKSACGHDCDKCGGGCAEMMVAPRVAVAAANTVGARPGDIVTVESGSRQVLGVAALVYLVPFFLFFLGYFLGGISGLGDGFSAGLGIVGFALGVALAILLDRRWRRGAGVAFTIISIERGS